MAFIASGDRTECPYCLTVVLFENSGGFTREIKDNKFLKLSLVRCPNCSQITVSYQVLLKNEEEEEVLEEAIIFPLSSGRPPVPGEVPVNIANDYNEACLVFPFSAKASAALARRCLQSILTNTAKTKTRNLSGQIDEVMDDLPSQIGYNLDAIREVGNFAAHEQKSTETGLILDVEPGEAEWTLGILESLFDYYYVIPAREKRKREELNKRLEEAGRDPLKKPSLK